MHAESRNDKSLALLQSLYLDATTTIRHYDAQRASFATLFATFLAVATSVVTFATAEGTQLFVLPFASTTTMLLAVLALLAMTKFQYLISLQRTRARAAMDTYQRLTGEADVPDVNATAKAALSMQFGARFSLGFLWSAIFAVILVANLFLVIVSVYGR